MKKLGVFFFFIICAHSAFSGGAKSGVVRAINTDSRSSHAPNHDVIFVMFEGSTDRYYLASSDHAFDFNSSALLAALISKQKVYVQWDDVALSSSFNRKITFVAVGDWPWPAN